MYIYFKEIPFSKYLKFQKKNSNVKINILVTNCLDNKIKWITDSYYVLPSLLEVRITF